MNEFDTLPPDGGDVPADAPRSVSYKGEVFAVPEAFWDAAANRPNLGALVKSHADLRRKLSEQRPAVPETYALTVPDDLAGRIAPDAADPIAVAAMEVARRHGLSQEAFSDLAALYYGNLDASRVDRDAEMERLSAVLGERTPVELRDLGRWMEGLLGSAFSDDPALRRTAAHLTATADGVMLLKALKDRLAERGVPSFRVGGVSGLDAAALKALQASDAYLDGDPAVRRKVAEGWERLFPAARD